MVRRFLACGLVLGVLVALSRSSHGDDKHEGKLPPPATNAGFEKMKKLVGTWLAADKDGKATDQVVSVIKVTAGGSALHETLFPGQPHEMVSVYTADGPDLIMTHYCVLGNQPRMKANPKSPANQIVFEFAGGTLTRIADMVSARWGHRGAVLAGGTVLVTGGFRLAASNLHVLAASELYEPRTAAQDPLAGVAPLSTGDATRLPSEVAVDVDGLPYAPCYVEALPP